MSFCLKEDKAELEQQNYITVLIGMFKYMSIYVFTLFKALEVCNQSSLLEWDIALIVTGVLSLVVGIVIIITGTVVFFTRRSE